MILLHNPLILMRGQFAVAASADRELRELQRSNSPPPSLHLPATASPRIWQASIGRALLKREANGPEMENYCFILPIQRYKAQIGQSWRRWM